MTGDADRRGATACSGHFDVNASGTIDEAALVTGKYLSPKLYVSHGYGLFDRVSTFRARYLLKKEVTVQAETGGGTGGDVLYRLERGR